MAKKVDETPTDPLGNYRLPLQVSTGVWIGLDRSDVKFRVLLPSQLNRAFVAAHRRRITKGVAITKDGDVDVSAIELADAVDAQILAFAETCIVECSAPEVDLPSLNDTHPQAVSELFDKAVALAAEHGEETEEVAKKPVAI